MEGRLRLGRIYFRWGGLDAGRLVRNPNFEFLIEAVSSRPPYLS
jgi:hypothetical protein